MKKRLHVQVISLFLLVIALGLWGCEKKMSAPIINSGEYIPSIDDYFPLSAGKIVNIVSTNTGYEPNIVNQIQYECGEGIIQANQSVYPWIRTNLAYSSFSDTSYFYLTDTALYFYETANSDPEKILQEPLEVGNTWQRFESQSTLSNNLLSYLLDGNAIDKNEDVKDEFSVGKIYPTTGSGLMTIVAIENVELDNGRVFTDCIKIHNENGDYNNYYWYSKYYGLVKYVIGASTDNLATAITLDDLIIGEYSDGGNFNL